MDAAAGVRWPSDSPWQDPRRRRTQGRRLTRVGQLLGVHPGVDDGQRERLATRLRVATMTLHSAAQRWARSWPTRGVAVLGVLLAITVDANLLDGVLAAGTVTGLRAPPQRWDAVRSTWVRGDSDRTEHPAAGAPRERPPPATNLPAVELSKTP